MTSIVTMQIPHIVISQGRDSHIGGCGLRGGFQHSCWHGVHTVCTLEGVRASLQKAAVREPQSPFVPRKRLIRMALSGTTGWIHVVGQRHAGALLVHNPPIEPTLAHAQLGELRAVLGEVLRASAAAARAENDGRAAPSTSRTCSSPSTRRSATSAPRPPCTLPGRSAARLHETGTLQRGTARQIADSPADTGTQVRYSVLACMSS